MFDLADIFASQFSIQEGDIRRTMLPCYKVFKHLDYGTANTAVKRSLALAVARVLSSHELDYFEYRQHQEKNNKYSLRETRQGVGCTLEPQDNKEIQAPGLSSPQKLCPEWMNKCSFVKQHKSRRHLKCSKSAMCYYQMLAVTLAASIGNYEIEKYSHKHTNTAPVITFHCLAENAEVRKDFFKVLKGCVTTFFGKGIVADGFSAGDEVMMLLHAGDNFLGLH